MTEDEARVWLRDTLSVSRETEERIERFIAFLREEMTAQNLISASTEDSIWSRHIVDSAQLLPLLPEDAEMSAGWIDLGSGAGFPGLVVAILKPWRMTLVESRAKRVDYLNRAIELLDLQGHVVVEGKTLERVGTAPFSVISARAFAPLPRLLDLAARFSTANTTWLLPKGRNAAKELEEATPVWHNDLKVVPSLTDADAGILVGHVTGRRSKAPKGPEKRRSKR